MNISLWGFNDSDELGVGLLDVEEEVVQRGRGRRRRRRKGRGDKRQKWKNLSAKCSASPERERAAETTQKAVRVSSSAEAAGTDDVTALPANQKQTPLCACVRVI